MVVHSFCSDNRTTLADLRINIEGRRGFVNQPTVRDNTHYTSFPPYSHYLRNWPPEFRSGGILAVNLNLWEPPPGGSLGGNLRYLGEGSPLGEVCASFGTKPGHTVQCESLQKHLPCIVYPVVHLMGFEA